LAVHRWQIVLLCQLQIEDCRLQYDCQLRTGSGLLTALLSQSGVCMVFETQRKPKSEPEKTFPGLELSDWQKHYLHSK
jgi:hypothetical protein